MTEVARRSGKRSQLWLQNFNLDEEGETQLEEAFRQVLREEPDDLACYYYWRNNANPERVWRKTHSLLRSIPRRQLHWHTSPSSAIRSPEED